MAALLLGARWPIDGRLVANASSPKPSSLIPAGTAQREGFERGQLAVSSHDVVVGDLDGGEAAALRSGINVECREAVGVRRVSHRRPLRLLMHIDGRALACLWVGFADRSDHPALRRVEEPLVRRRRRPTAADDHVNRTLLVSITSVAVDAATGVRVAFASWPRIGCERS